MSALEQAREFSRWAKLLDLLSRLPRASANLIKASTKTAVDFVHVHWPIKQLGKCR